MFGISMRELILSLSDFLKTDTVEVKEHKYTANIGLNFDIFVSFRALKSSEESIYVSGIIEGFVELECSRCLNLYKHHIEISINTNIEVDNLRVDVGEEVRQLLLLEMPMKPICNQDCLGICRTCGRHNKKNSSCNCRDSIDESAKERWEELLNNKSGGSKKMPNPKRKHTPYRRDCRRSANSKLDTPNASKCSNCGASKMPHKVCPKCGFYNGKLIVTKKVKKAESEEQTQQEVEK
jgi:ribosomal protein L32